MKKELKIIFGLIVFVLIIIAGVFLLNSKNKITGNAPLGSCSDLDGKNYFEKGTCLSGENSYQDNCTASGLIEYYCGPGELGDDEECKPEIYNCSEQGAICSEGACIISEISNCLDGTTLGECNSTTKLYCDQSLELVENCTACGCDSGYECNESTQECFESGCSSTDTGTTLDYDFSVFGSSTLGSITWNDSCINSTTLNETFCDLEELNFTIVLCNSTAGEVCSNGACQVPSSNSSCSDSDNGIIKFVLGTCSDSLGTFTDSCYSSGLQEYYCNETTELCQASLIDCGTSMICQQGICIADFSDDGSNNYDENSDYSNLDENTNNGVSSNAGIGGTGIFGIILMILGLGLIILSFIKKAKYKKLDQQPQVGQLYP